VNEVPWGWNTYLRGKMNKELKKLMWRPFHGAFFILLMTACAPAQEDAKTNPCIKIFSYGTANLCVPALDSLVECYSDQMVQSMATQYEAKGNTIRAFYMSPEDLALLKQAGIFEPEAFMKIYTIDQLGSEESNDDHLHEVADYIASTFPVQNWEQLRVQLESGTQFISPNQSLFLERYAPAKKIESFLVLYNLQKGNETQLMVGILNIILVKKKLVGLAYYLKYRDPSTLDKAKAKNEAMVTAFLKQNTGL
jgi:hypothetical protein